MVQTKEVKQKTDNRIDNQKDLLEIIDVFPYKRLEGTHLVTKNNTYQTLLKIETKNIYNLSEGEQYDMMDAFTNLCRLYIEDFGIVSLMFPANTSKNLEFWRKKLLIAREQKNIVQMMICNNQIKRMMWVENALANHEFYVFVYGETKQTLEVNKKALIRNSSLQLSIADVSPETIELILFKLNNQNTQI